MSINERIFQAMKEKNITQGKLAQELNTTQSVIGNWKSRGTTPSIDYLPKLSETLDTSWEWIVTGQENPNHLSKDEQALIDHYRRMNPTGKKRLMETASELSRLYIGRHSLRKVANGTLSPKVQAALILNKTHTAHTKEK